MRTVSEEIPDYLDDEDYLVILSIGKSRLSHTNVQKVSYVLSNITEFKGKFTSYDHGHFSETIMERIQSPLNRNIYAVKNDKYYLTPKGIKIYEALIQSLPPDIKRKVVELQANQEVAQNEK